MPVDDVCFWGMSPKHRVTQYLHNLQDVGTMIKVIVRPEDEIFWERCISLSLQRRPVCGVGNPGIGKTTTSIYLLQKLVREMYRPVVYTIRKKAGSKDVFYEITPVVKNDRLSDVIVKVFKILPTEKSQKIPAMKNDKAVFCVDPGLYEFSCDDRDELFEANFIMISSNDEKHWGGTNFTKFRGAASQLRLPGDPASSLPGILVFASLWTGRQVIAAKPHLHAIRELDDNDVQYRVRVVGGSLRDVLFFDETTFRNKVQSLITGLETNTVHQLVEAKYLFSFKPQAPSSVLVGIGPANNELTVHKVTLTSDYVAECLATAHLKMAWYAVLDEDNSSNRGNLFEAYLRILLSQEAVRFDKARESLREKSQQGKKTENKNYQPLGNVTVGSKRTVRRVAKLAEAVSADITQQSLYYSKDEFEPLIDMIFRVDDGYNSVQATVNSSHDAAVEKIRTLKSRLSLKDHEVLRIYYAMPSIRYEKFVTDPVNPLLDQADLRNVHIYHIGVDGD